MSGSWGSDQRQDKAHGPRFDRFETGGRRAHLPGHCHLILFCNKVYTNDPIPTRNTLHSAWVVFQINQGVTKSGFNK